MDPASSISSSPENAKSILADSTGALAEKPRIKMQLYKTEPCQNWAMYGTCRYGNLCKFAHGMTEQRSRLRHPKYKTSLCKDFPLGKCTFGVRCNFAHSLDELRISLSSNQCVAAPQAQAVIQTPVTMLPDGRLLSTFTPINATTKPPAPTATARSSSSSSSSAALKSSAAAVAAAAAAVVAGELRRNQSMGTLRGSRVAEGYTSTGAQSFGASGLMSVAVPGPSQNSLASNYPSHYAYPSPKSLNGHQQQLVPPASEFGKQPFHHLHHERVNVTRRVASLSQLPTISSAASVASSSYLQSLQLNGGGLSQPAHLHTSPLAHVPIGTGSPALSSPSYSLREFDEPSPIVPQADFETHASEWLQAPQQPYFQPPQPQQPPQQRRTLTSSISMQTLPRYNMQTNWEPAKMLPSSGVSLVSGSSQPTASLHVSTSALIDSNVWGSTSSGISSIDLPVQSQESRFFPSSIGAPGGMLADPLGIHYPSQPMQQQQQKLQRQVQSSDEWTSLHSAYPSPVNGMAGFFSEPTQIGIPITTAVGSESRLTSLEQLRAATSSRKQFGAMTPYSPTVCL